MVLTCPPKGSESVVLFPALINGSLFAVDLKAKRSGAAAAAAAGAAGSLSFDANRSGSELLVGGPNGPAEAEKGSSVEKAVLEVCAKKESAANGSEPLNGSPPNGSDETERAKQKQSLRELDIKRHAKQCYFLSE